ncbi:hypothetical protein B0I35DRAFT_37380 [Stachybotrys elegans]|uniref:NADH dehydrogenase [ubiquinone] 1 alpha subcomplex subunit n=1 Tax=Stachybotrys elegans TaxID=80388 RepID=A0A8K0T292_9HYPO|nr:hypothetical protein B0I35DRAFT_37380 [Stachybotrys elegans]
MVGLFSKALYRWKALRLPWRKRFLVGHDLQGNTYWEFRLTRNPAERWRRIVEYPRSVHFSQVKVSPLWHQWLRYTRDTPPSIEEQKSNVAREARMKILAAEADARWEAKPRVMEDVGKPGVSQLGQPVPPLRSDTMAPREQDDARVAPGQAAAPKTEEAKDPWAKARAQGPGENWQPASWSPPAKGKK